MQSQSPSEQCCPGCQGPLEKSVFPSPIQGRPPAETTPLLAEHPYLKNFLAQQVGEGSGQNADETPVNTDPAVTEPLDDDALQELFSEVERKRHEYAETPGCHGDFLVSLLGGKWAMESKGVPVVAFQGKARNNSPAEDWCNQYALHRSARFEISMYGEQVASALAHGWCDRMSHFFSFGGKFGPAELQVHC